MKLLDVLTRLNEIADTSKSVSANTKIRIGILNRRGNITQLTVDGVNLCVGTDGECILMMADEKVKK